MKKSTFNIALLSVLFVLGACSVDGSGTDTDGGNTVPGGTGDPATDAALGDALGQLTGSVEGMEIGSSSSKFEEDGFTYNTTDNLYLGSDKYASIRVEMTTGGSGDDVWDNDVKYKSVSEGALVISDITADKVKTSTSGVVADLKGYSKLHTQTPTLETIWHRESMSVAGAWDPNPNPQVLYYLVKETWSELSRISVTKNGENYTLNSFGESMDEVTMATAIANATTYKKKSSDTGGGDVTVPGGTGDPVTDAALGDALDKIGSVEGMEVGSSSSKFEEDGFTYNTTDNLYLGSDKYASIRVDMITGTDSVSGAVWDNDPICKSAKEGALAISAITAAKVKTSTGNAIADLQGYSKLHTRTQTLFTQWQIETPGEEADWSTAPTPGSVYYFIVKETSDELSIIQVEEDGADSGNYKLTSHGGFPGGVDMDIAIANTATTYKIK